MILSQFRLTQLALPVKHEKLQSKLVKAYQELSTRRQNRTYRTTVTKKVQDERLEQNLTMTGESQTRSARSKWSGAFKKAPTTSGVICDSDSRQTRLPGEVKEKVALRGLGFKGDVIVIKDREAGDCRALTSMQHSIFGSTTWVPPSVAAVQQKSTTEPKNENHRL